MHRDLKPSNVMVETKDGPEEERYNPVIIDFGLANIPYGTGGTPRYLPPEAFGEIPEQPTAIQLQSFDTFALGSILFEIKYRKNLHFSNRSPKEFMEDYDFVMATKDPMSHLIAGLIARSSDRLTIEQALAHPWLNPTDTHRAAAILFDGGIDQDEDIESIDMEAHSAGQEVPVVEQAVHSFLIVKECAAIPKEDSKAVGANGCEQQQ